MRKISTMTVIAVALAGCGSTAQNSDVGLVHTGLGPKIKVAESAVQVTDTGPSLSNENQRVLGTSCKNKMWDPSPSEANAVNLMKQQAAERGYNAVHSVKVFNDPTAIAKNCWSALIASGIAYKTETAAPIAKSGTATGVGGG